MARDVLHQKRPQGLPVAALDLQSADRSQEYSALGLQIWVLQTAMQAAQQE